MPLVILCCQVAALFTLYIALCHIVLLVRLIIWFLLLPPRLLVTVP